MLQFSNFLLILFYTICRKMKPAEAKDKNQRDVKKSHLNRILIVFAE